MAKRSNGFLDGEGTAVAARLVQIVGIPALLFISTWMFNTLNDVSTRVVRLEEQMKINTDDRYRGTQARADFALRDEQLRGVSERLTMIEKRLNRVEVPVRP